MALPTDYDARKALPIYSGVLKYFPNAIAAVAHCSVIGNAQHNPGEPLHWAREKSTDEHNTCVRHLIEAGTFDVDGVRHSAKAAWRALAALEKEIEADGGKIHGDPGAGAGAGAATLYETFVCINGACMMCGTRHTGACKITAELAPACPHGHPLGERCARCPGGWTRSA